MKILLQVLFVLMAMDIDIDISPWLLSSMYSDLTQTARFTAKGRKELNPLAKPIVEPRTAAGEAVLGLFGTPLATSDKIPKLAKVLWAMGHTMAVLHNAKNAKEPIPGIIFPTVTIRGDWDRGIEKGFRNLLDRR